MKVRLIAGSIACASVLGAALASEIEEASCRINGDNLVTVYGNIRLLRTVTRPFVWPDGSQDYSIIDSVDEYELSSPDWPCGREPLLVRFRYGHVKAVSCPDNIPASVSGFYRRDAGGGRPFLSVMTPGGIRCHAPPAAQ